MIVLNRLTVLNNSKEPDLRVVTAYLWIDSNKLLKSPPSFKRIAAFASSASLLCVCFKLDQWLRWDSCFSSSGCIFHFNNEPSTVCLGLDVVWSSYWFPEETCCVTGKVHWSLLHGTFVVPFLLLHAELKSCNQLVDSVYLENQYHIPDILCFLSYATFALVLRLSCPLFLLCLLGVVSTIE